MEMIQEEWKNREIEFQDDEYAPDFEEDTPYIKNNKTTGNYKADRNIFTSKGKSIMFYCY